MERFISRVRHLTSTGRICLVLDGYYSHLSYETMSLCRKSRVIVYTLPSHTSHRTQPLDVSVFGPMKTHAREEFDRYAATADLSKKLDIYTVLSLLDKAYDKAMTSKNIKSGFRKTCLWLWKAEAFDYADFKFFRYVEGPENIHPE